MIDDVICVVDYDSRWPLVFDELRARYDPGSAVDGHMSGVHRAKLLVDGLWVV